MVGTLNGQTKISRVEKAQINGSKYALWAIIPSAFINIPLSISTLCLTVYTKSIADSTKSLREDGVNNIKLQIRPYLVTSFDYTNPINKYNVSINASAKNVGQTPAYHITYGLHQIISPRMGGDKPLAPRENIDCGDPEHSSGSIVIGAGEVFNLAYDKQEMIVSANNDVQLKSVEDFSQNTIDRFNNHQSVYLLYGSMCYKDVFNNSHITRICKYAESFDDVKSKTIWTCSGMEDD